MRHQFQGWAVVGQKLLSRLEIKTSDERLNEGQQASIRLAARRLQENGLVIADEVGMGKTRIAVEIARAVVEAGGRVAILIPPGLGFQWQQELMNGGLPEVPGVLRSYYGFLTPWDEKRNDRPKPWFENKVLLISHAFANWRLRDNADLWRWSLLPEIYIHWRKHVGKRSPRRDNDQKEQTAAICSAAAESIVAAIPKRGPHPLKRRFSELLKKVRWPLPLTGDYSKNGAMRPWMEQAIGAGLGVFDFILIDEAHKSRHEESGLSTLVNNVIASSDNHRRLAVTATPVELDVTNWNQTLERISVPADKLCEIRSAISDYAEAVKKIRQVWRGSPEAISEFRAVAQEFQKALSPYILRRDKRTDPKVRQFAEMMQACEAHNQIPVSDATASDRTYVHDYRHQSELIVRMEDLSESWKRAICAAESLSFAAEQSSDPRAKRMRLTIGNGHGIAKLLDECDPENEESPATAETDESATGRTRSFAEPQPAEIKQKQRVEWWSRTVADAFRNAEESLFDHPAIRKSVEFIEDVTTRGEKVLVFGTYLRPLRALEQLLNAREMLRCLMKDQPWPQEKVHESSDQHHERLAVLAANRQFGSPFDGIDSVNRALKKAYRKDEAVRRRFREMLIPALKVGINETPESGIVARAILARLESVVTKQSAHQDGELLPLLARGILELFDQSRHEYSPKECAEAFCELIAATIDRDEMDVGDEVDDQEGEDLWSKFHSRLNSEFSGNRGGFARLMAGDSRMETRRMIQAAFNRPSSFLRVLVAQSRVGREGLKRIGSCIYRATSYRFASKCTSDSNRPNRNLNHGQQETFHVQRDLRRSNSIHI